jgi:hypothetical protein
MTDYVLVKLDEVSVLTSLLEHELTRIDDVPVARSHLLDRVNAMIDAFIQMTHPNDTETLLDFVSEEFHDYRNMVDIVDEFLKACERIRKRERHKVPHRIRSIRIVDLRSDVLIQLS